MSRSRVLALLVTTCILFITLDARGSGTLTGARNRAGDWMSPLQGVGRAITNPVRNAWRGITSYDDLQRENDRLREINAQMIGDSIASQAAIRNWQELSAQADLESVRDYSNVTAQVLTYGASNNRITVEINKGSADGIRVGMPVVNAAGLVGKVTRASNNRAIVLLISDPSYSVPVTISGPQVIPGTAEAAAAGEEPLGGTTTTTSVPVGEGEDPALDDAAVEPEIAEDGTPVGLPESITDEVVGLPDGFVLAEGTAELEATADSTPSSTPNSTAPTTTLPPPTTVFDISRLTPRETGGLEGRGPGKTPVVRFVSNDRRSRNIRPGDVVLTNGGTSASGQLSSLAPADLVVGRVKTVIERAGGAGPEIEVEPAADLDRLNFVRVIRYIPPSEAPA